MEEEPRPMMEFTYEFVNGKWEWVSTRGFPNIISHDKWPHVSYESATENYIPAILPTPSEREIELAKSDNWWIKDDWYNYWGLKLERLEGRNEEH